MEIKWAYEWSTPDGNTWQLSKAFATREEAVLAANHWFGVCAENDFYVCVRLRELEA